MKNFRRFAILVLCAFSTMAYGQDLGLPSMIYPVPNQRVHLAFQYPIEFVMKNYGSSAVANGTSMTFNLYFDGTIGPTTYNLSSPKINAGDSISITIPVQTFSTPNPTMELCVVVNWPADKNKANDTICNTLRFSVDNNIDIGPTKLDILVPDVDSIIKPSEQIIIMDARIRNFGTVTLPRDYTVKVETRIGTQTRSFSGKTTTALDTGAYFDLKLVGSQPPVPSKSGPFQFCVTIVDHAADKNPSNDEHCQIFYAYDFTSVGEVSDGTIDAYPLNGELILNNVPAADVYLRIFNLSGQVVMERSLNNASPRGTINISTLERGVYILNITSEEGVLLQDKISID